MGARHQGGVFGSLSCVADNVAEERESPNGEAHENFVDIMFNLASAYVAQGHVRLIGQVVAKECERSRDPPTKSGSTLTFEDVLPEVKEGFKTGEQEVKWGSTYRSHYNVSSSFRSDKAFIVGDAAHTHNPLGGQCMNVGVMYAINLMWKPANVTEQRSMTKEAKNALLGAYESER
ncbi:hypothetical protein N7539_009236 [Penicillium diatomitis]|uniref:FAD-binding domain-containing protein n=1 Tax=Penicillium diatomitis TaxID=2819901 RepID=A0A9W9WLF5_9EURO|nr:uncharacterized protein N7539_009236 [Penicillium diatomitis]KAJ5469618.1 hypothetical protein N7539_009236 [Penicillium diatomitis]